MLISIALVVLFAIAAFIWGIVDGRADARANPDPDRRGDLAMTWLLAGLFAGVVSGAVAWFISLFYKSLYVEALLNELTTFAAFTALLVFLFAIAGVSLGRWLVDRKADQTPHHHAHDEDRADTDVFAAVRQPAPTKRRRPRRRRRTALAEARQVPQRQYVALHAEADDHAGGHCADVGVVPKLFARMHIRDMHLDKRCAQLCTGVAQRHRRVGERAGVEHHRLAGVGGGVDPAQQFGFAIGLPHNGFQAQFGGFAIDERDQVFVGGAAVDLRLAATEPAEVRTVDDLDCRHCVTSAYAAATNDGSGPSSRPGLPRPSSTTKRSTPARVFLSPAMYSSSCGSASAS